MGYTHYWTLKLARFSDEKEVELVYQKAIDNCKKVILAYQSQYPKGDERRLAGVTPHAPHYGGIDFNGARENAHEQFYLRETYEAGIGQHFCKTAGKPYDVVVVACLCILRCHLPEYVELHSDGDDKDWDEGAQLAYSVTKYNDEPLPYPSMSGVRIISEEPEWVARDVTTSDTPLNISQWNQLIRDAINLLDARLIK